MNGPNPSISPEVEFSQFAACDLRVGTILSASPLEMAKTPAYVIELDFGEWGSLKSTAQLTLDHTAEQLVGRQVVAVVNLPPKTSGKAHQPLSHLGRSPLRSCWASQRAFIRAQRHQNSLNIHAFPHSPPQAAQRYCLTEMA